MAFPRIQTPSSREPTESGYDETEPDSSRQAIVVHDRHQLYIFDQIDDIDSRIIEPTGPYPRKPNVWLQRSEPYARTKVYILLNIGQSDVMFFVTFDTKESIRVHVPLDSWCRHTCDSEAVRAALQQAYLNVRRGLTACPVIVTPFRFPLRVLTPEEYHRTFRPSTFSRPRITDNQYIKRPVQVPYRPPTPPLPRRAESDRSGSSGYRSADSDQRHYYSDNRRRSYYVVSRDDLRRRRSRSWLSKVFS